MGSATGMYNAATMLYYGAGTTKNPELAIKIWQGLVAKHESELAKQRLVYEKAPIKADEEFDVDEYFKTVPDPEIKSLDKLLE
jgi:TPR repeat protein